MVLFIYFSYDWSPILGNAHEKKTSEVLRRHLLVLGSKRTKLFYFLFEEVEHHC